MNLKKLKIMIIGLFVVGLINTEVPTTYRGFVENPYTQETIELAKKVGYLERANECLESKFLMVSGWVKNRLSKSPDEKIAARMQKLEKANKNISPEPNLETIGELINPDDTLQSKINYLRQKWTCQGEIYHELCEIDTKLRKKSYSYNNDIVTNNDQQNSTDPIKSSSSFLTRFNNFISDHKTLLALGGLVVLSGIGYAMYNWCNKKQNIKQKAQKDTTFDDFIRASEK